MEIEDLEKGSITNLVEDLRSCIDWAESLGTARNLGRLQIYRANLVELLDLVDRKDFSRINKNFAIYANALYEAAEVAIVLIGLRSQTSTELEKRLKKAVSGPARYIQETNSANNIPRNKMFELLVASRASISKLSVALDELHDATINLEGMQIDVECKRLQSSKKIGSNAKKAIKQLVLNEADGSNRRGLVAIDITKLANPEFGFISVENVDQVSEQIAMINARFIKEHLEGKPFCETKKLLGFLVRNSCIAHVRTTGLLVYEQRFMMHQTAPKGSQDAVVVQSLTHALMHPPPL